MSQERWMVKAVAMNRRTREQVGKVRSEKVGTNNLLFRECRTTLEVEEIYEAFWNDLIRDSDVIVKVISVKELS